MMVMQRTKRRRHRRRDGSATAEFAILLPIFLTLAMICVDYGRFCHANIAVKNAAREGAYKGAITGVTAGSKPLWDAAIQQAVEDELANNGWFNAGDLVVAAPTLIDEGGGVRRVSVDVSYPFNTVINLTNWPLMPGYNDPITLRHVAVMRLVR